MMRFPFLCVASLLGLAVLVPAQQPVKGHARQQRGPVVVVGGNHHHDHHDHHEHHRGRRDDHHHHDHGRPARRVHVHGRWENVCEQVLVPGYWRDQHYPPTYGWVIDHCGHRTWGVVAPGGCRRVWVPARWETRTRRVWVTC